MSKVLMKLLNATHANSYSFLGCDYSRDTKCTPEHNETINVIKDTMSKFEICPKTSHLCKEINANVVLNERELNMYDYAVLNVLGNGYIRLSRNSGCKVSERSFLEINKNASTMVDDKSVLVVTTIGELHNLGAIFVGNNSLLQVFDHAHMQVLEGGVFRLKQKSDCEVTEQSLLKIDKYASAVVNNNSQIMVIRSELNNNGMIFVGERSLLHVLDHAQLKIISSYYNNSLVGLVHIDKSSEASIRWHSKVEVAPAAEIRVEKKGAFKARRYSDVLVNSMSKIIVEDASRVTVSDHSSLQFSLDRDCWGHEAQFLTRAGSKVFISASKIIISIGQLIVDDQAELSLYDGSTIVINGLFEINDWDVRFDHGRKVVVGEQGAIDHEPCDSNASLIITNSAVLPKELIVLLGAHCFTKNTTGDISDEKFANATVQLNHDSDTSEFKCFNSRAKLKAALVGFQRRPTPKHDGKITPRHVP